MHIAGIIDGLPIPYMCDLSVLAYIKNENLVVSAVFLALTEFHTSLLCCHRKNQVA